MAFDCIERALKSLFSSYGAFIARHPLPFLLLPLLLAGGLGAGMMFLTEEQSVENLYTPENGRAKTDRQTVEDLFHEQGRHNDTLVTHLSRLGRAGSTIIRRTDGGNILEQSAMQDIFNLHEQIMNITILHDGDEYTFSELCIEWNGVCNENFILAVYDYNSSNVATTDLTYPLHTSENGNTYFLGGGLGGVDFKFGSSDEILSAEAIQLSYFLRFNDSDDDQRSALWEDQFLEVVETFNSSELTLTREVSSTLETELDKASSNVVKDFSITFTVLIQFSIWSCVMFDWVRNKPLLAGCGVISAGLAVLSSFGLMSYIGIPYINVVGSAPFLVLGIGVDDMFIMVSAWRQTDVRLSAEERMRHAFSEAAMSITITSITDALAFGIGAITYFRSVRIFCMYTGVAVLFDYAYQITFFGACMALSGRREAANRHCMCCLKVKPKSESTSVAYRLFCAGGSSRDQSNDGDVSNTRSHALMLFFKHYYGPFITHWLSVLLTIILYLGYLAAAVYGCTQVREGLALRNLARDNSYAANYLDAETTFFTKYGPQVELVFTEPKDVWNPLLQSLMEHTLTKMEASEYAYDKDQNLTVSWLRDYLDYLDLINLNKPTKSQFIETLRQDFLKRPAFQRYSLDIVFNEDDTEIIASRFFVVTKDLDSTEKERFMMTDLRKIVDDSELPAMAYHPAFIFFDQYTAILPNTLQNIGIAAGAMLIVALLMIPHPICSIMVTLSLASIVSGVVGFMTMWQVNLDSIAMTNLILCIGFSVDFSAHISYAYISANKGSRRKNVIHALYSIGMPIVQGSASTILGVTVLAFTDSYIFRTFFKTMFLVISLGALHGLLFLPVFLMLTLPAKGPDEDGTKKLVPNGHSKDVLHGNVGPYFQTESPNWQTDDDINPFRRSASVPHNIGRNIVRPRPTDVVYTRPPQQSLELQEWQQLAISPRFQIPRPKTTPAPKQGLYLP